MLSVQSQSSRLWTLPWCYSAKSFLIKGWKIIDLRVYCSAFGLSSTFLRRKYPPSPPLQEPLFSKWLCMLCKGGHLTLLQGWPTRAFCLLIKPEDRYATWRQTFFSCLDAVSYCSEIKKEDYDLHLLLFIKGINIHLRVRQCILLPLTDELICWLRIYWVVPDFT